MLPSPGTDRRRRRAATGRGGGGRTPAAGTETSLDAAGPCPGSGWSRTGGTRCSRGIAVRRRAACQRVMFDWSWYGTPSARRSSGVAPVRREMKDELVAIVDEPRAVDWLVVAHRQVAVQPGGRPCRITVDRDRLDPVQRVLQLQVRPDGLRDVERGPRVRRLGADVQEERAVRAQVSARRPPPIRRSTSGTGRGAACPRSCDSGCRGCMEAT